MATLKLPDEKEFKDTEWRLVSKIRKAENELATLRKAYARECALVYGLEIGKRFTVCGTMNRERRYAGMVSDIEYDTRCNFAILYREYNKHDELLNEEFRFTRDDLKRLDYKVE